MVARKYALKESNFPYTSDDSEHERQNCGFSFINI